MPSEWFVRSNDREFGPISAEELKQMAERGRLTVNCSIRRGRQGKWMAASSLQGLKVTSAVETTAEYALDGNSSDVAATPPFLEGGPPPVQEYVEDTWLAPAPPRRSNEINRPIANQVATDSDKPLNVRLLEAAFGAESRTWETAIYYRNICRFMLLVHVIAAAYFVTMCLVRFAGEPLERPAGYLYMYLAELTTVCAFAWCAAAGHFATQSSLQQTLTRISASLRGNHPATTNDKIDVE